MSNQPQPRPWFRLATLARASQPQTPPPTTTQPQTQAPVGPLLRAPTFRPAFRPTAPSQPQPPPPRATIPPPPSAPTPPRLPVLTPYARPAAATPPSVPASPKPSSPRTASPASPVVPPSKVTSPTPSKTLQNSPPPTTPPPSPPVIATKREVPSSFPSPPKPKIESPVIATKREVPSSFPSPPKPKIESPVIATKREVPSSFPSPPKPKTESPPSSKPSSPVPKTSNGVAPSSSSLKASPVSVAARLPTPVASPRAAANHPLPETPKQSPLSAKATPVAPPSPFSLPPSQTQFGASDGERESKIIPPEAEKKTVVQETTVPKQKPKNGAHTKPKGRDIFWKSSDDEEGGLRVITIAGENRGAVMELGYSPRRRGGGSVVHKVVKSEEADQLSRDEVRSKMEAQNGKTKPGLPMNAIMNSNVQGVNSSILLNSKCFHHDPGVHFSLTRKPFNGNLQAQGNNSQNRENGKWFSN